MAASTRISGKKVPVFTLGSPGTSYSDDLISLVMENEDGDQDIVTFLDASAGGSRQFYFRGSATQSTVTGSLWRYNWDNSGSADINFIYAPHGNAIASVLQPHYTGKLTIGPKPALGGEASASTTGAFTFDFEFAIDGVPAIKTAP